MANGDLRKFYDNIYKKGEESHYTKFLFARGSSAEDRVAVLKELSWKGKSVLDIGCGTGETAYAIACRGAQRVIGIDYSKDAITAAEKKYRHPRLSFLCQNIADTKGTYDAIITMGALEHIDSPLGLLKKCKRMLARGGSIIVTSPNWSNPRGYILLALKFLFDAPVTLADIHYFTPRDFEIFASKLKMNMSWKTVDHEWSQGGRLIKDFERRLPNVLRDAHLPTRKENITAYLNWLKKYLLKFEKPSMHTGAIGVYHFK